MITTESALQEYLHDHIPLSAAMGIRVEVASPERVLLWAPLEPNINHRGTGFGGSIASIATLAGWSWLWVLLRERSTSPRLVIRKSDIDYVAPAEGDFTAELRPPSEAAIKAFIDSFDRRGSGKIDLKVEVLSLGEEVAHFRGTYVVIQS